MTDINHVITKALVDTYGQNTLFVLEDLTDVSFNRDNLSKKRRNQNRSWSFYQFEQFLIYKAEENHSAVVKVAAAYTSQRCPKCGTIRKENRSHDLHEYFCKNCSYRSNDDRIAAMNIYELGKRQVSGDLHAHFTKLESLS